MHFSSCQQTYIRSCHIFYILLVMVVIQTHAFVKTPRIIAFKEGIFTVCKLSQNKADFKQCRLQSTFHWSFSLSGYRMLTPVGLEICEVMLGTTLPGFRSCKTPWPRLSDKPWDHKPLRRQSLSPWQGHRLCPLYSTLLGPEPDQLANYG